MRGVEAADPTMLRNATPQALGRALRGRSLAPSERHGKWLVAADGRLLLHFGMTGLLAWAAPGERRHPHDRVVFLFGDGELRYRNMRKLGGVWLARDERERGAAMGPLGPDALSVSRERLDELLAGRRGGAKAALMDQHLIAGIGNLLSDEILWRARVHPRTPVAALGKRRRDALHRAMRETLGGSISSGRVPHGPEWLTAVRDERDPRCPRCGGRLRKETVAGRTACWCPRCQRRA